MGTVVTVEIEYDGIIDNRRELVRIWADAIVKWNGVEYVHASAVTPGEAAIWSATRDANDRTKETP